MPRHLSSVHPRPVERAQRRRPLRLHTLVLLVCLCSSAGGGIKESLASGLEVPGQGAAAQQRGGADTLGISDPSAAFLNPGLLSRQRGLQLLYSHSLIWNQQAFTRSPSQIIPPEGYEATPEDFQQVENEASFFPLNGLFAVSYDFGLPDWNFAFSFYGPNGTGVGE